MMSFFHNRRDLIDFRKALRRLPLFLNRGVLSMKFKLFGVLLSVFCGFVLISVSFGADKVIENYPAAILPEVRYDFEPVIDGLEITHAFIIQNKGTAPLEIEKVKTG